ncbi:MAG: hypothetical protein PHS64_00425 [Candidatus Omnitrophica bacterium]|nr:hypothetical protein [Candidatus Omnitrophota bacterium]
MKKNVFQKAVSVIACVAVICCTGPAWAANFEACTYSRSAAGSSYSSSGTNMGATGSYSGMGTTSGMGSVRSGGSFNPVSAFKSGMTGARTTGTATTSVNPSYNGMPSPAMPKTVTGSVIQTAQSVTNPVAADSTVTDSPATKSSAPPPQAVNTLDKLQSLAISQHGEKVIETKTVDINVETGKNQGTTVVDAAVTDVPSATQTSTQDKLSKLAAMNPAQRALTQKFEGILGEGNVPSAVEKFGALSPDKQMQALEYGNGDIWLYQETKDLVGADGKPLWKDSMEVLGDIWDGMSQEGQYKDKDGNLITNSPYGTNGAGQPDSFKIMFREGYTADDLRAFSSQWCAENNVVTSCGLQEVDYNKMMYDAEAKGIIYMLDPQEQARYRLNPSNTRANAQAFLTGSQTTYVESTYHWVQTQALLGTLPNGGNNEFGGSVNDRTYIPPWIEVNDLATEADFASVRAEVDLLYRNASCLTENERADLYLAGYERKGLVRRR